VKPARKQPPPNGALRIDYLPLAHLLRAPRNPKDHELGAVSESYSRFGYVAPMILDERTGKLVAGHGRLDALQQAKASGQKPPTRVQLGPKGEWLVPVVRGVAFKSDVEAESYLIADNQLTMLGGWDDGKLAELLSDLAGQDALAGIGFDKDDVDALLRDLGQGAEERLAPKLDQAKELQKKWKTALGQLWEIPSKIIAGGRHRISCCDSMDAKGWTRLMGGYLADLLFTDPPYGVDYTQEGHERIENDTLRGDALAQFLAKVLTLAVYSAADEAAFYIWHASATRREFEWAMNAAGLEEKQYLIWAKESFTLGHADYHWQHEPCFYAQKAGQKASFTVDRTQSTVWRCTAAQPDGSVAVILANGVVLSTGNGTGITISPASPKKKLRTLRPPIGRTIAITVGNEENADLWFIKREEKSTYLHPTQKPIALAMRAIANSSLPGQIVVDCFLGGGGTAVAAEKAGRLCYGLEIEPKYVAVTLQRLADMGLKPKLAEK